jgi:hypothetical protein
MKETNKQVQVPSLNLVGHVVDHDPARDEYELQLKSGAKLYVLVRMTKPVERNLQVK